MDKKKYIKTKYPNIYKNVENGTYAVDLSLGYNYKGKRIRTTRTGLKTEKEAKELIKNEEYQYKAKQRILFEYNFEDFLDEYFEWCKYADKQKPNTIKVKKGIFETHILSFFKGIKLSSMDGNEKIIEDWHKTLINKNIKNDTRNTIHKKLSAYLSWIIKRKQTIKLNPCSLIKNFELEHHEIKYYTDEQISKLRNTILKENNIIAKRTLMALDLLYSTGLRFSELQGLKINDFDIDLNKECKEQIVKMYIRRNIIRGDTGLEESDGKTNNSLDSLYVGKNVIGSIQNYLNSCKEHDIHFNNNDYIFKNEKGLPLSQHTIRTNMDKYIKKSGLPHRQIKELRNSTASYLISNGYDLKEVQEQLRHTRYSTTDKHYAKLYEDNKIKRAISINNSIK